MAKFNQDFIVSEAPARSEFTLITPGDYVCMVTDEEENENGSTVLKVEVQEGDFQGKFVKEWLNFTGDEQWKIDQAYAAIGELAAALGKKSIKATNELHNKRFIATIGCSKPSKKDGKIYNDIKKYLPYSGAATGTTTKTENAAVGEKPAAPWKTKKA